MMDKDNYVVIMAGGVGSRFWPYSRTKKPKQFLDVIGTGESLLQTTFDRFRNICPVENIFIVTNDSYIDLIKEQLPKISQDQILGEPFGKNTAPCIAYASYKIHQRNKNARIVVAPSDHIILKEQLFEKTILEGLDAASGNDKLITIGIKPHKPETGYGYIQFRESDDSVKPVKTFTEKPSFELAEKFIESGDFVWNAGIFIWTSRAILDSFELHLPEIAEIFEGGVNAYYTKDEKAFIAGAYFVCKNISIDYGIMENAKNVFVILGDFGWSDLGSWPAVHEIREKDENQNVIDGDALVYNSTNCIIKGQKDKLIVVEDLDDYLVADCDNVLVICKKGDGQRVKDFVKDAKQKWGKKYL